jgi:hypothetical protein
MSASDATPSHNPRVQLVEVAEATASLAPSASTSPIVATGAVFGRLGGRTTD